MPDPELMWHLLQQNGCPKEHLPVWRHILDSIESYPKGDTHPWRRQNGRGHGKPLAVMNLYHTDNKPLALELYARDRHYDCTLHDSDAGIGDHLVSLSLAGSLILVLDPYQFQLILQHYARKLVQDGYEISPFGTVAHLRGLRIKGHRHTWWYVDRSSVLGNGTDAEWGRTIGDDYHAAIRIQSFVEHLTGVDLGITLANTAIRGAQKCLPSDADIWRLPAWAVSLCRTGRAFRGGYLYARPYHGECYKYDQNRAYLSAMQQPLRLRVAFGPYVDGTRQTRHDRGATHTQDGVFVCTIRGPGIHPIYIAPWNGRELASERLWNDRDCVCVLPVSEFAGIRALGYTIVPGWGMQVTHTTSIAPFADALGAVIRNYDRDAWQARVAKQLGNAVYGKFAEGHHRPELRYALSRPDATWSPFVTVEGDVMPYVWCREASVYRTHQHIDIAAHITGMVRSRTYEMMGRVIENGYGLLYADTDAIVTRRRIEGLTIEDKRIGGWRLEGFDTDGYILSERRYKIGDIVRDVTTGTRNPKDIEVAYGYHHGSWYVDGERAVGWR